MALTESIEELDSKIAAVDESLNIGKQNMAQMPANMWSMWEETKANWDAKKEAGLTEADVESYDTLVDTSVAMMESKIIKQKPIDVLPAKPTGKSLTKWQKYGLVAAGTIGLGWVLWPKGKG